ncbi:MAG TPA: MltA domain-containing protein [Thermoanaerobaculia bacterium]|jgi:membrane-bound lytic murein transglycosylase A|nr:MltA domain-containing protein [Thermoanaerobaculia bacterium]
MSRRRLVILLAGTLAVLVLLVLAFWRARRRIPTDHLVLKPAAFTDLPGWRDDPVAQAIPALHLSCRRMASLPDSEPLGQDGRADIAGTAGDWRSACAGAARVPAGDDRAARAFFETHFRPFAAADGSERSGLFTGYYEALLQGSRKRSARYHVPLYGRPPELVTVDLGKFREDWHGKRISGRVEGGALVPLPDRAAIEKGALARRGLELVWVDSPVDAFFLEIQGSGRIRLAEGGEMRVGYAADNGRTYTAIGRELVRRGVYKPEEVSMQSIRRWLDSHPGEAEGLMDTNASYVFFAEAHGEGGAGPLGAEGVPLTPGRSLAVDRRHWPLGVPLWLDATAPAPQENQPDRPLRRLLIAQDTGGAIRGPIRGDVFWGAGPEPESIAGRMKNPGRLWVLLPVSAVNAPRAPSSPLLPASPPPPRR